MPEVDLDLRNDVFARRGKEGPYGSSVVRDIVDIEMIEPTGTRSERLHDGKRSRQRPGKAMFMWIVRKSGQIPSRIAIKIARSDPDG